jgi:L-asparaginase II
MAALPGRVLAKVGAAGIYCAALPAERLGVALKVADGDSEVSPVALLAVLRALSESTGGADTDALAAFADRAEQPILNTRGTRVGTIRATGSLRFHD